MSRRAGMNKMIKEIILSSRSVAVVISIFRIQDDLKCCMGLMSQGRRFL
jgi:hypothetical protein